MTGFEIYLESKGYELISGKYGDFSTYKSCSRLFHNKIDNSYCCVGLYAEPTRIGIISPVIYIENKIFSNLPVESQFEEILKKVKLNKYYN